MSLIREGDSCTCTRPHEYHDIDLDTRRLENLNATATDFTATILHRRRTGKHFVPRMNAKSHTTLPTLTYQVIIDAIGQDIFVPETFNWNDPETRRFITPVMDQGKCGGCWSFCVCSALGSRTAIAKGIDNPILNPIHLMSTTSKYAELIGNGCDGGDVTRTSQFVETCGVAGIKSGFLTPEQFRQRNHSSDDTRVLNQSLPKIASCDFELTNVETNQCTSSQNRHNLSNNQAKDLYFARQGCTKQIYYDRWNSEKYASDILKTIALEMFLRGPVSTVFMTYPDFYDTEKWPTCIDSQTGLPLKVYVHEWTDDKSAQDGEHAAVITGRGVALSEDGKTRLPYWICQNEWGTAWGDQGYFNIAMNPFNSKVGLDVPFVVTEADGTRGICGGVTVILPDCDYSSDMTSNDTIQKAHFATATEPDVKRDNLSKVLLIVCIAVIIVCAIRLKQYK